MENFFNNQRGYIISIVTFFVLILMLSMAISMGFLVAERQRSATNIVKSAQSYYAAESGIEDALLRLKKTPQMSPLTYNLVVNSASTTVNIPSTIGISKSITSQADNNGMARNVQAICSIDNTQNVSFYYGVEVGEGGLETNPGSIVKGNVFSAGNISGGGIIDNDAVISGNGHSISGVTVKGNALAHNCLSGATIEGDLTYVTGGTHTCSVGGVTHEQATEIAQQPLPIPQSQIDDWKAEASTECNSTDVSDLTKNGKTVIMGPCKITGSISFGNNVNLTMNGTIYVTGNVTFGNGDNIKLSSGYSSLGGVFISNGTIELGTSDIFSGSGQPGSYVLLLSTSSSDSAIFVKNNSTGGVFYTSAGGIDISNGVSVVEATGYKVIMQNNSTIEYSSGIVNIYFTSGPGGGWKLTNWQEY